MSALPKFSKQNNHSVHADEGFITFNISGVSQKHNVHDRRIKSTYLSYDKVWELLLNTATKYSAQYFYLAPKFPRQLEFNDDMRVLACMSGANKKRTG